MPWSIRLPAASGVAGALEAALASGRPAVVEVLIDAELGTSGGQAPGWWDVPVPGYLPDKRAIYDGERREEVI